MQLRIKGKLFILLIMTVLLASLVTSLVIIVNEERARGRRFAYRMGKAMQDISHLISDYQYETVRHSRRLVSDQDFTSSLHFINYYSTIVSDKESYEHEVSVFSSKLTEDIAKLSIDEVSIFDIEGKNVVNISKSYRQRDESDPVVVMSDCNPSQDMLFLELSVKQDLQISYITPVHLQGGGDDAIGYVKAVKFLDNAFYDELKRLDGVDVSTAYIKNGNSREVIKKLWGLNIDPVVFPFTEVKRNNIRLTDKSGEVVHRFDISEDGAVYFHIVLPSYILPFSFANTSLMFFAVLIMMILLLIPMWWLFMNKTFVAPIKRLLAISDDVKKGEYGNISQQLTAEGEFYDLEKSFVSMVEAIKDRETQLDEVNWSLVQKVDEETARRMKNEQIMLEQKKFADMGQMINAIAHQWRQPLNGLSLVVQNICDDYREGDVGPETLDQHEESALQLIAHMSKTIDDFRDFFSTTKEMVDYNVVELVCEVIAMVNPQMKGNGIDIKFQCTCGDETQTCVDKIKSECCKSKYSIITGMPGELKQAILNLIQNSKDAIKDRISRESRMRGVIDIRMKCELDEISISVKDNGGGIPEELIDSIFNPYFTTKSDGTGIGLYMTRTVIQDNLKGNIIAYNEDEGAVFEIALRKKSVGGVL